jgi:hypothetical protein
MLLASSKRVKRTPDHSLEALNKELHPHAEEVARKYVDEFAASLLLQAKMLAFQEKADLVLSNHIDEAREVISRERKKRWSKDLLIVVGSALFGAFIPGFITELSAGHQLLIVVYTIMGFLGMLLVFLGLRR